MLAEAREDIGALLDDTAVRKTSGGSGHSCRLLEHSLPINAIDYGGERHI